MFLLRFRNIVCPSASNWDSWEALDLPNHLFNSARPTLIGQPLNKRCAMAGVTRRVQGRLRAPPRSWCSLNWANGWVQDAAS